MSGRLTVRPAPLAGVALIERAPVEDSRGLFERLFCDDALEALIGKPVRQINRSVTRGRGVVRGVHFQRPPKAETKIVTCLRGAVFDVAIDLRRGSPTFLQRVGERLSEDRPVSMLIPEGFGHGFQTLSEHSELLYLHFERYAPECEGGLNAMDRTLRDAWPQPIARRSARDEALPFSGEGFEGIAL